MTAKRSPRPHRAACSYNLSADVPAQAAPVVARVLRTLALCSIGIAAAPACELSMLVGATANAVQHFQCTAVVLGGAVVQY